MNNRQINYNKRYKNILENKQINYVLNNGVEDNL